MTILRQGSSKKGRGKYGRNDHRAPLSNHDRAQEVFTLLNTTYEAALMNEHEKILKPNNRKPNRQDNRDTGKFCRYHQQNSHNTEDCISLRKIVERLIGRESWTSTSADHSRHLPQTPIGIST
ncbi:unnamed protein product [Prunus armeniaca]